MPDKNRQDIHILLRQVSVRRDLSSDISSADILSGCIHYGYTSSDEQYVL